MAIKLVKHGKRSRVTVASPSTVSVSSSLDHALPLEQCARASINIFDIDTYLTSASHYTLNLGLDDLTKLIAELHDSEQWLIAELAKRSAK